MSEQIPAGPHDWDEFKRICKRCGCTTTDWHVGSAKECGPGTHVGRTVGAAADDFPTINRRLGEIEKEKAVELVQATERFAVREFITGEFAWRWTEDGGIEVVVPSRIHEQDETGLLLTGNLLSPSDLSGLSLTELSLKILRQKHDEE